MIIWKTSINSRFSKGAIGCNLESPKQTSVSADLVFSGWALHETPISGAILRAGDEVVARMPSLLPRPDVVKARAKSPDEQAKFLYSGFKLSATYRETPFRISLMIGDEEVPFLDVEPSRSQASVLHGHNDYLFLDSDSNGSVGQFTGRTALPDHAIGGWRHNFKQIKAWESIYKFVSAFVIAPAKEEILPEFYPYARGKTTLLDQFVLAMSGEAFILTRSQLIQARNYAYSRTDTHWTDAGATIAAAALLDYWKLGEDAKRSLPDTYSLSPYIGDLGAKLTPHQPDHVLTFSRDLTAARTFHNGVLNNGDIHVYETPEAPVQATCVIFGDSFGVNFAAALSPVFRRLIYTYRPAAMDTTLIEIEKPQYVALQINQRFLVGQPDFRKTIFETAAEKLASLPEEKAQAILATWKKALDSNNAHIARSLISAYESDAGNQPNRAK